MKCLFKLSWSSNHVKLNWEKPEPKFSYAKPSAAHVIKRLEICSMNIFVCYVSSKTVSPVALSKLTVDWPKVGLFSDIFLVAIFWWSRRKILLISDIRKHSFASFLPITRLLESSNCHDSHRTDAHTDLKGQGVSKFQTGVDCLPDLYESNKMINVRTMIENLIRLSRELCVWSLWWASGCWQDAYGKGKDYLLISACYIVCN